MIDKILPYLSKNIPDVYSLKALSKLDPRIAAFMTAATAAGYGMSAIKDFMSGMTQEAPGRKSEKKRLENKGSLSSSEQLLQQRLQDQDEGGGKTLGKLAKAGGAALAATQMSNPDLMQSVLGKLGSIGGGNQQVEDVSVQEQVTEESPSIDQTLDDFIRFQMSQGRSAIEAGALANNWKSPNFKAEISNAIKKFGMPFSQVVESIYGSSNQNTNVEERRGETQRSSGGSSDAQRQLIEKLQNLTNLFNS